MDGMKCILQLRGVRPFLSSKFDITKHKNYRFLSDANPKYAFDIGKFVSTKLKIDPDEKYSYFEDASIASPPLAHYDKVRHGVRVNSNFITG